MNTREMQLQLQKAKQQNTITDQDIALQNGVIEERDEAIKQISEDFKALNEITGQLATLVNKQSGVVDNIATNITKAGQHIKDGNESLAAAEKLQDMFSCRII